MIIKEYHEDPWYRSSKEEKEYFKSNLLELAEFLKTLPKEKFDIEDWSINGDVTSKNPKELCGTVACAVGWSPMVIPVMDRDYYLDSRDNLRIDYSGYSERVFGASSFSILFDWLFSSEWVERDNTSEGVLARISYFLENGTPHIDMYDTKENYEELIKGYLV